MIWVKQRIKCGFNTGPRVLAIKLAKLRHQVAHCGSVEMSRHGEKATKRGDEIMLWLAVGCCFCAMRPDDQ